MPEVERLTSSASWQERGARSALSKSEQVSERPMTSLGFAPVSPSLIRSTIYEAYRSDDRV